MKRLNPKKPPYVSVALIVRNTSKAAYVEGWSFEKTLQSVRARLPDAEIVIVDTMSCVDCANERTAGRVPIHDVLTHSVDVRGEHYDPDTAIALEYADVFRTYTGPNNNWTREMHAFDDAAAARRHSFSLCHGKWIVWIDADDELPDGKETERLLKLNNQWRDQAGSGGGVMVDVKDTDKTPEPMWMEDVLHLIEANYPKVECLVCPYLYAPDKDGLAIGGKNGWQSRERFIKRRADGSFGWNWKEEGHEVMVPDKVEDFKGMHQIPSWLWVHKKLWTPGEQRFTVDRHFRVLHEKYLKGDRTTRNLIYLSQFSNFKCPEKKANFIAEALEAATTTLDFAHAHIEAAFFAAERGLYNESRGHLAAAATFRSDLPDAWVAAGDVAVQFEDSAWAVNAYREALKHRVTIESQVNPRVLELEVRAKLIQALHKLSDFQISLGEYNNATAYLEEARELSNTIYNSPAVGPDVNEAHGIMANAWTKADGHRSMMAIHGVWQYLIRNDETEKAVKLIPLLPNTVEDHPLKISMEQWAVRMKTHFDDESAYYKFYDSLEGNSQDGSPEAVFDVQTGLARTGYIAGWLHEQHGELNVFELAPYDGPIGSVLLRECGNKIKSYIGVDASRRALDLFQTRIDREGTSAKATLLQVASHYDWPVANNHYDLVICGEVIEHVPDPVMLVQGLLEKLAIGGRLVLTTPWMSYDRSLPKELEHRDPRGHVRAMTLRDVADVVDAAGGAIEDAYNSKTGTPFGIGETMHTRIRRKRYGEENPVTIVVPGALWNWNSRMVHDTGMGASEETIVYLAKELAKTRKVEVYGPVNEAEVHHGVAYWPLSQLRHADKDSNLIISRAPSFVENLEHYGFSKDDFLTRILWLQDVGYPDLNDEVAALYDDVVILTQWHADSVEALNEVNPDRMTIIGNFLLPEHFTSLMAVQEDGHLVTKPVARKPHHFIYSSSPDRGLIELLEMWPEILKAYPDATLDIFYGWEGAKKLSVNNSQWTGRFQQVRKRFDALKFQKGVTERGRINHVQLGVELRSAAVWYYPCHKFLEAGCLSAIKARAAGAVPVVPPIAALPETALARVAGYGVVTAWLPGEGIWEKMTWAEKVTHTMAAIKQAIETPDEVRQEMSKDSIERHSIAVELTAWKRLLK